MVVIIVGKEGTMLVIVIKERGAPTGEEIEVEVKVEVGVVVEGEEIEEAGVEVEVAVEEDLPEAQVEAEV